MRPPRISSRSGLLWIKASSELPNLAPSEARSPSRPLAICDLGSMLHEFNCATPTAGAAYRPGAAILGRLSSALTCDSPKRSCGLEQDRFSLGHFARNPTWRLERE